MSSVSEARERPSTRHVVESAIDASRERGKTWEQIRAEWHRRYPHSDWACLGIPSPQEASK